MDQFDGISLRTRMYVLILAAFIPVAMLIVYVAEEQKTIEKEAILHRTMLMAKGVAEAENLQMTATRDLMIVLAGVFLTTDGQPDLMSKLLSDLRSRAEGYAIFGILDPKGQLVAGDGATATVHDYASRPWFASSLKNKKLTMGPYYGERIDGNPVLYFAKPIFDRRHEIAAVAFAAMDLKRMNGSFFNQLTELPSGSRLTLVDEQQVSQRYIVDTARWSVAQPLDPSLQQEINNQASGVLVAEDENGISRIYAFAHLKSALQPRRVAVVLEIPRSVALAASNRIFVRNLALLIVSALLAIFAIWWAANSFILKRIGAIVSASRRLIAGDFRARVGQIGARDEIGHLAGVFDEMAESLQMRIEREEQVMTSLKHSQKQLRRLSAYQNDIREQERIRIAREIHDQLGQSLTILKLDLTWLRKHMPSANSGLSEKIKAMVRLIGESLDKLHEVTAELRPVILDDFGLAAAIEWQVEIFRQRSGIGCRFQNNNYEPDLSKDQATALFRIFQELLTNIIRHAEASDVIVRLEERNGELRLQVSDNGRGITENEINAPKAFGLLGIRERLYPLGGKITFEGRPQQGTRVIIHLPLNQKGDTI
jgi:signal transduction histidine kinase